MHTGTAPKSIKALAPATMRKKMNSPMFVLPAMSAAEITFRMHGYGASALILWLFEQPTIAMPHFRPSRSVMAGRINGPRVPPAK